LDINIIQSESHLFIFQTKFKLAIILKCFNLAGILVELNYLTNHY